ncbi:hypothetical protein [Spongiimicrobium salis]|uniref:hypothetical protein n=1 Tax=Spongiimicrobium salis TaxID=1667022 RepID=UPI00374CD323
MNKPQYSVLPIAETLADYALFPEKLNKDNINDIAEIPEEHLLYDIVQNLNNLRDQHEFLSKNHKILNYPCQELNGEWLPMDLLDVLEDDFQKDKDITALPILGDEIVSKIENTKEYKLVAPKKIKRSLALQLSRFIQSRIDLVREADNQSLDKSEPRQIKFLGKKVNLSVFMNNSALYSSNTGFPVEVHTITPNLTVEISTRYMVRWIYFGSPTSPVKNKVKPGLYQFRVSGGKFSQHIVPVVHHIKSEAQINLNV